MRLHGYQEIARDHLLANPRAALFLDMGLGKTATVLSALADEHLPALVIAPKRVAEHVWSTERRLWRADLSMAVAAGTPSDRRRALSARRDITVIGRDNIADAVGGPWRTVVLDELSGFKNRSTKRWKAARKICTEATYVWGLTGTPAPNGYEDLWAQLFLLDSGQRLGRTLTSYREQYFTSGHRLPTGVTIGRELRTGAKEIVNRRIADICLSMSNRGLIDLPPVTFNRVEVDLPSASQRIYSDLDRDLVSTVTDVLGEESVRSAATAASLTNRLQQVTAGFVYPDTDDPDGETVDLHAAKIDALREIVEGTGSPVLTFYHFRREIERLREAFPEARSVTERGAIEAWNAGRVPMLLAHPASAGHGLNLQRGGHTAVWTSLTWSSELWEQANARLARQGQQHPVVIHTIEVPGSIDETIREVVLGKVAVQDSLMAYLHRADA